MCVCVCVCVFVERQCVWGVWGYSCWLLVDFPGQRLGAELTFQISNLKCQHLHVSFLRPFNFSREDSSIPPRRCEPVYLLETGVEPGSSSAGVSISTGLSGFQPTPSAGLTVPPSWGLRPLGMEERVVSWGSPASHPHCPPHAPPLALCGTRRMGSAHTFQPLKTDPLLSPSLLSSLSSCPLPSCYLSFLSILYLFKFLYFLYFSYSFKREPK